MNTSNHRPFGRFPWYLRIILLTAGCGFAALLTLAATLTPDPSGIGTHRQLGLNACQAQRWWGEKWGAKARCPSCGMTTAWSHMTRGQVIQSFQANSGGALLAMAAGFATPWLLISAWLGRWLLARPDERVVIVVLLTIVLVTLVDWAVRMIA